jgi:ribonucleoside-diphosphate reductase alpha chain
MKDSTPVLAGQPDASSETISGKDRDDVLLRIRAIRNRLPDERMSLTHKFNVGGHEGYITVGLYPDGDPGEIFITMAKEGSTVSGLISSFAQCLSIALQHGVALELFCEKFAYTRFEPSGWTGNPEISHASSVMDYIFRWLRLRFTAGQNNSFPTGSHAALGKDMPSEAASDSSGSGTGAMQLKATDAPACRLCGSLTNRNGSCFICGNCGASTGCA